MTPPTVFISYSHDSQEHKLWVISLAERLCRNGVNAILDQWDLGPGGDLPQFMEQSITRSNRILMVCTERYVQKANTGSGGVGYEKMIVTSDLINKIGSTKIIPIVRQNGLPKLPVFLGSKIYINLSTEDMYETGFDTMLRVLLNAPLFIKPPLGSAPTLTADSKPIPTLPVPLDQFMLALASVYKHINKYGFISKDSIFQSMAVSLLMFDHAYDLAKASKLVYDGHQLGFVGVNPSGRMRMLELEKLQVA